MDTVRLCAECDEPISPEREAEAYSTCSDACSMWLSLRNDDFGALMMYEPEQDADR